MGSIKLAGAIGVVLLLLVVAAMVLSKPRSGPDRGAVFQDLPALARLPRSTATVPAPGSGSAEQRAGFVSPIGKAEAGSSPDGAGALANEVRSNRQAIRDIDGTLRDADVGADKLRSQVARQDDTIAAQREALETGATTEADRSDAEAVLAAAIQMNDAARASLSRYETTRSALLKRKMSLQQRDAEIASRLKP